MEAIEKELAVLEELKTAGSSTSGTVASDVAGPLSGVLDGLKPKLEAGLSELKALRGEVATYVQAAGHEMDQSVYHASYDLMSSMQTVQILLQRLESYTIPSVEAEQKIGQDLEASYSSMDGDLAAKAEALAQEKTTAETTHSTATEEIATQEQVEQQLMEQHVVVDKECFDLSKKATAVYEDADMDARVEK